MQFLQSSLNEYLLSPVERRQKHDLITALQTLECAIKEFHLRADSIQPSLKSRDLLQNSTKAISIIRGFVDRKFDGQ